VATRSVSQERRRNAETVLSEIQSHSPALVAQTKLVSDELIRIAILWHEQWHEALEEASRLYFGEQDVEGMLATLMPLHDKLNAVMDNTPPGETKSERFFKMVLFTCIIYNLQISEDCVHVSFVL
jgi:serine/threonine-protein kinase mTOR